MAVTSLALRITAQTRESEFVACTKPGKAAEPITHAQLPMLFTKARGKSQPLTVEVLIVDDYDGRSEVFKTYSLVVNGNTGELECRPQVNRKTSKLPMFASLLTKSPSVPDENPTQASAIDDTDI